MAKVRCIFYPQAWVNDYAIDVDPEGETAWEMVLNSDVVPESNTYESDELRTTSEAPEWVRQWHGPFYIDVEVLD